jgi:hypothetical protein
MVVRMRTDNQSKRRNLETQLDKLLLDSYERCCIKMSNGRIDRAWVRKSLCCGANWVSQNTHASKVLAEYEKELRVEGGKILAKTSPGFEGKESKRSMMQISMLEQRNAQLLEENAYFKARLYEYGWLSSEDERAAQGRLPW